MDNTNADAYYIYTSDGLLLYNAKFIVEKKKIILRRSFLRRFKIGYVIDTCMTVGIFLLST